MLKKIILISLGVIILAACGLGFYITNIDWNTHKEKLATELSALIGKKIIFSGQIDVDVFPHPRISATSVNVVNPENSAKLATIKQLETEISLGSLLKRAPDIQSLSLNGVEVWVKIDKEGESNWHQNNQKDLLTSSQEINFNSFNIRNSILHFNDERYATDVTLEKISLDVNATNIRGPYRIDGTFKNQDDDFAVAIGIDGLSQLDDLILNIALQHPRSESSIIYDGTYNADKNELNGILTGNSKHSADLFNILLNKMAFADKYNVPLEFSVKWFSDAKKINLSRLVIRFGGFLEGSGDIEIPLQANEDEDKPTINIKYQLVNADMRPIIELYKTEFEQFNKGKIYNPDTDFNLNYDITAEKVILNDDPSGIFENASAKGSWIDNVFSLDDFYAGCTGNVVLTMSGSLEERDKMPHYFFNVSADGKNFLSFLNSLGIELKAPSNTVYQSTTLAMDVDGTPQKISLDNIKLKMDGATFMGSLATVYNEKRYDIKLQADKLNLDNYVLQSNNNESTETITLLKEELQKIAKLSDKDWQINAQIKDFTYHKTKVHDFLLDAIWEDNSLIITDISGTDIFGSKVNAAGVLEKVNEDNPQIKMITYNIESQNFKALADIIDLQLPQWSIFSQKNFKVNGSLSGNLSKINLETQASVNDIIFAYKGDVSHENGEVIFDGGIDLKTTRMENMLSLINIKGADTKIYRGALNFKSMIKGNSTDVQLSDIDAALGKTRYIGNLKIQKNKGMYNIIGDLNVDEFNLNQLFKVQPAKLANNISISKSNADSTFLSRPNFSKDVFDFSQFRNIDFEIALQSERALYEDKNFYNFKADITNAQNILKLENLSFNYDNIPVSGNLEVVYIQSPLVKGKLHFENLQMNNVGGSIYALQSGDAGILDIDFSAPAVSLESIFEGISGNLTVSFAPFTIKGISLSDIAEDLRIREYSKGLFQAVKERLQTGETDFERLDTIINLKSGVMYIQKEHLSNDIADVLADGTISLKDWKLNLTFNVKYKNLENIPEYSFNFSGSLNKPIADINVGAIANKYDEHWRAVEKEEQQRRDEEQKLLQDNMSTAQKEVDKLSTAVDNLSSLIDECMKKVGDENNKYQAIKNRITEIYSLIVEMQKKKTQNDYNVDDIAQIQNQTNDLKQEIAQLSDIVNSYYHNDVAKKLQNYLDKAVNVYNQGVEAYNASERLLENDKRQLKELGATDILQNNAEINEIQKSIKNYKDTIDTMYNDFLQEHTKISALNDDNDKLASLHKFDSDIAKIETIAKQIENAHVRMADSLLYIVTKQRNLYNQLQQEKQREKERQAQEDAQNLLISDSPLTNHIETIETPKENIFSEKTSFPETQSEIQQPTTVSPEVITTEDNRIKTGGKIIHSYEKEIITSPEQPKTGHILLKPAEGAVQKVSGTINIK